MKTTLFTLLITDTAKAPVLNTSNSIFNSFWFWCSLIEFIIILFLFFRLKKSKSNLTFSDLGKDTVKGAKSSSIDMDNLMNSINSSGELYKELSRKCHPDKFINSPLQKLAEEIFQEISRNKRNFEKLTQLKERATKELNINF